VVCGWWCVGDAGVWLVVVCGWWWCTCGWWWCEASGVWLVVLCEAGGGVWLVAVCPYVVGGGVHVACGVGVRV
jgi:hypothetical protein